MQVKFLDLKKQYHTMKDEMDRAIASVMADTAFIGGKYATKFEEEFAAFLGAKHVVGCANGTDAIEIALEALDLPPQSEVIVPANSFIATSEAASRQGLKVVFADVDPEDYTISPLEIEKHITAKTKVIIAVHLYGHPCQMDPIMALAKKYNLHVLEDCAQAHGAKYHGKTIGTIGHVSTFSFYPGKNLGAYGDAGAMVTNDPALAKKMRMIANHGRISKYDHEFEGRNSRLDGLQGAILSVKLRHLDGWLNRRIAVAAAYTEQLSDVKDLVLPITKPECRHVFHLFVVRSKQRHALNEHLSKAGIETGVHYPIALPRLVAYQNHPQHKQDYLAASLSEQILSIPMGEHLTDVEVSYVSQTIKGF